MSQRGKRPNRRAVEGVSPSAIARTLAPLTHLRGGIYAPQMADFCCRKNSRRSSSERRAVGRSRRERPGALLPPLLGACQEVASKYRTAQREAVCASVGEVVWIQAPAHCHPCIKTTPPFYATSTNPIHFPHAKNAMIAAIWPRFRAISGAFSSIWPSKSK